MAVAPIVFTALVISLSITLPVTGSNPEVGSSNNNILGFPQIALAIATLFCIPPEISEGKRSNISGFKLKRSIIDRASFLPLTLDIFC